VTRAWITAWAFGISALAIVAAAISTAMLPSSCGEIGRPNVDFSARATLVAAVIAWLAGALLWLRVNHPGWVRVALAVGALGEVAAWIAIVIYYRHQTARYGNCG
jgi:hypothetical protein